MGAFLDKCFAEGSWEEVLIWNWTLEISSSWKLRPWKEVWSLLTQSSLAEQPVWRILLLRIKIALASDLVERGPPPGATLTSSTRSSPIARSATLFLFLFLAEPISRLMDSSARILSSLRDLRLAWESTRIVMGTFDLSLEQRIVKLSLNVGFCSFGMNMASVKLVRLSLMTRIFWLESTKTSALKKMPAADGFVSVVKVRVSLGTGEVTVVCDLFDDRRRRA